MGVQRERSVRNVDLGNVRVQVVTEAKVVAETVQRACSEFRGGSSGRPEERPSSQTGKEQPARGERNLNREAAEKPSGEGVSRREWMTVSKAAKRSGEIRPEKMFTRFGDKLVTGHLGKGRLRGRGGPEQAQMG